MRDQIPVIVMWSQEERRERGQTLMEKRHFFVLLFLLAFEIAIHDVVRWSNRVWGWRNTVLGIFTLLGFCVWGPSIGVFLNLEGDRIWVCFLALGGLLCGFLAGKLLLLVLDLFVQGPVEDSDAETPAVEEED
jgi:hypothetical protein